MSRLLFICVTSLLFILLFCPKTYAQARTTPLIVNHQSLSLYSQIPVNYKTAAHNTSMLFQHASIGFGLYCALLALNGQSSCNPNVSGYNYFNEWLFHGRGNPSSTAKADLLYEVVSTNPGAQEVYMFKYCYIDYAARGDNRQGGLTLFNYVKDIMETLESNFPTQTFVWWTMPLTQSVTYTSGDEYNLQVRQYVQANNKILLDLAALESHDPSGNYTILNGLETVYTPYCGDAPPNCHLNPLGAERVVKAMEILMAQLSGWNPGSSVTPPPSTSTPVPPPPEYDFIDLLDLIRAFDTTINNNLINIFDFNALISNR